MDNMILDTGDVLYYVVRVNGQDMSPKYSNQMLAEAELQKLAPEMRSIAEVVPVTADGKQLLLGQRMGERVVVKNRKGEIIAEKERPFDTYKHPSDIEEEEQEERYDRAMGVL